MENIEQLKQKIKDLENQQSFVVKTGDIIYCHNPESPKENFTKIEVGIDCTEIIMGKVFKDFVGFQISKFNKELFAKFDQTGTPEFKVGDKIKVILECGSYQTAIDKKLDNRMIIYNNVSLVNVKMVESHQKGNSDEKQKVNSEEKPKEDFFEESAEEKAPF